jgi:hypothetical protein
MRSILFLRGWCSLHRRWEFCSLYSFVFSGAFTDRGFLLLYTPLLYFTCTYDPMIATASYLGNVRIFVISLPFNVTHIYCGIFPWLKHVRRGKRRVAIKRLIAPKRPLSKILKTLYRVGFVHAKHVCLLLSSCPDSSNRAVVVVYRGFAYSTVLLFFDACLSLPRARISQAVVLPE